ncbi:MAG TPA: hypothetical protein VFB56_00370 [Nitrospiraceae bacterium]|nr:hypothetical protein [Nitrospiraceae bacterium]
MSNASNKPRMPQWPPTRPASRAPRAPYTGRQNPSGQYDSFNASLLYCNTCKQATPTRERLLLVLPTGNLYEYLCAQCGASTGSKTETEQADARLFKP